MRIALVLVLAVVGCRAPKSDLSPPEVLRFGVGHMGGSYYFVVLEDGHASYEESGGGRPTKKVETTVTKEELAALAKTLREHDLCGKSGSSRKAVPDEHAKAALAAIESFGRSIGERGK